MSQTFVAQFVLVLAYFLPKFGVNIGNEGITAMVQGVLVAVSVLWTIIRRFQAGGVNLFGKRI